MSDIAAKLDRMRALGLKPASELPRPRRVRDREAGPTPQRDPAGQAGAGAGVHEAAAQGHEYVDATPRRPRRDEDTKTAEDALNHHFVVLLSLDGPVPRSFSDQRGILPMWVETAADWRTTGDVYDKQQVAWRAVRLAVLGVKGEKAARLLKAELDTALGNRGRSLDAESVRHAKRFANAVDFGPFWDWWPVLLADVVATLQLHDCDGEVFTRAEHEAAVEKERARRIARRIGRG